MREAPRGSSRPEQIREALAAGKPVSDRRFDLVAYPRATRRASAVHWTPVKVAMRAARFLAGGALAGTVVDVGAGVGKFCLVAAASTGARVHGVEHRAAYLPVARAAFAAFGVDATIELGSVRDVDAARASGLYLFNPFFENRCPPEDHLDATVELSEARFHRDVAMTLKLLDAARPGTRLAIYCGFGADVPEGWVLVADEDGAGKLELYEKQ